MPSFFKPARGVQKPHIVAHKPFFNIIKTTQSYLNFNFNLNYFAPCPVSSVFDSNDCIWYYGTLYVKEAVAVVKLNEKHVPESVVGLINATTNDTHDNHYNHDNHDTHDDDNDDDAESVSSSISGGNPSAFTQPRSIAKQNQIKYLKDGMRLRHAILANRSNHAWDHWHATFHAETNRIIRTPDGVAFDTLRQFARLHCNEVLSDNALYSTNVWSDPHFMYQDDADGQWHPLANLKKK